MIALCAHPMHPPPADGTWCTGLALAIFPRATAAEAPGVGAVGSEALQPPEAHGRHDWTGARATRTPPRGPEGGRGLPPLCTPPRLKCASGSHGRLLIIGAAASPPPCSAPGPSAPSPRCSAGRGRRSRLDHVLACLLPSSCSASSGAAAWSRAVGATAGVPACPAACTARRTVGAPGRSPRPVIDAQIEHHATAFTMPLPHLAHGSSSGALASAGSATGLSIGWRRRRRPLLPEDSHRRELLGAHPELRLHPRPAASPAA